MIPDPDHVRNIIRRISKSNSQDKIAASKWLRLDNDINEIVNEVYILMTDGYRKRVNTNKKYKYEWTIVPDIYEAVSVALRKWYLPHRRQKPSESRWEKLPDGQWINETPVDLEKNKRKHSRRVSTDSYEEDFDAWELDEIVASGSKLGELILAARTHPNEKWSYRKVMQHMHVGPNKAKDLLIELREVIS